MVSPTGASLDGHRDEDPDTERGRTVVTVHWTSPVLNEAKVIRLAYTALSVFDDSPPAPWDDPTRMRLARAWVGVLAELGTAISSDTLGELQDLVAPLHGPVPSEGELRLMRAQIVGWLNGLMMGEEMSTWAAGVAGEQELADTLGDELASDPPPERASPYR